MLEEKLKKLSKLLGEEAKKLDKKAKEIENTKLSITKTMKKNTSDIKKKHLKKLQDERKKILEKVKKMRTELSKVKRDFEKSKKTVISKKSVANIKLEDKTAKKVMKLLATYNKMANDGLISILLNVKDEDMKKDNGSFFKSILGTFNHILACDIYFFKTFRKYSNKSSIPNEDLLLCLNEDWTFKNGVDKDIRALFGTRKKMDDLMIDIVSSIDDFNVIGEVIVPGKKVKKSRYHLVLHEINHDTHHRGEISAMLDQLGYKNDYSNLLTYSMK